MFLYDRYSTLLYIHTIHTCCGNLSNSHRSLYTHVSGVLVCYEPLTMHKAWNCLMCTLILQPLIPYSITRRKCRAWWSQSVYLAGFCLTLWKKDGSLRVHFSVDYGFSPQIAFIRLFTFRINLESAFGIQTLTYFNGKSDARDLIMFNWVWTYTTVSLYWRGWLRLIYWMHLNDKENLC